MKKEERKVIREVIQELREIAQSYDGPFYDKDLETLAKKLEWVLA